MFAPEGNSLFCFPEGKFKGNSLFCLSKGKFEGNSLFCFPEGKNKTNYFPRGQTLSVLSYSDEPKSTLINNIHTTIVFRDKNSIE